jgi:serine/threonine protein kinase
MATGSPPWKELGLTNPVSLFQHISKSSGLPQMSRHEMELVQGVRDGAIKMVAFKNLIARCFDRIPEQRPSTEELLNDIFFSDENNLSFDEPADGNIYRSFNSPTFSATKTSKYTISSPPGWANNLSPIQQPPIRRSNSIGHSIGSPMFSPPLPKRNRDGRDTTQTLCNDRSPLTSPVPNGSEWPTWAKNQLPSINATPSIAKAGKEVGILLQATAHERSSMDSLVYSESSNSNNYYSDSSNSPLFGEYLLK